MDLIGIIGAMDEEVEALKVKMEIIETKNIASLEYCKGRLHNKNIVVVRAGIGKVNAAICTQILIDEFNVDAIINVGVAGAIENCLNIGDIVISTSAVEHDMDATNFGYAKGVIPRMDVSDFKADKKLIEIAYKAGNSLDESIKIHKGKILSGDLFVSSNEKKKELYEEFSGYCAEMEGASIAHTAYLNEKPFVIIRSISDKADDSAEMNYSDFVIMAAKNSSELIENMLELI